MTFKESLEKIEKQAAEFVWWSPSQIARGEDKINDPKKGQRAWSVPRATGEFLHKQVLHFKPKNILELGTSLGYSTLWLAHAAQEIGAHVYTIEHFENKFDLAQKNILDAGFEKNVTCFLGKISDVLQENSEFWNKIKKENEYEKIDFVFMDADRGHYHEYFPLFEKNLSEHAVIIADNAENMNARMQPFLELLKEKNWTCEILDFDNGILVARPHPVS